MCLIKQRKYLRLAQACAVTKRSRNLGPLLLHLLITADKYLYVAVGHEGMRQHSVLARKRKKIY